jgi:hypothetical protein
MSEGVGQCPAESFCEGNLNLGLTRVGSDNVRLDVSVLDGLEKTWNLLDSTIFTSFNTSLLIVRYSYTQQI